MALTLSSPQNLRSERAARAIVIARVAALLCIAAGIAVLFGWRFGTSAVTQALDQLFAMKANSALGFVVGGVALFFFSFRALRPLARLLGFLLLVGAGLTLGQGLVDLNIGDTFFVELLGLPYMFSTGRMPVPSAIGFVLLGLAFLASAQRPAAWLALSQLALALVLVQSAMILIGHDYGEMVPDTPLPFTAMAIDCAVMQALLAAGLLAACPERGLARAMVDESAGGQMFRRLLPGIILIPVLLGWLRNQGEIAGLYGSSVGTALFTVSAIVLMVAFSWWTATALRRMDEDRLQALADLHGQRERLTTTLASIADGVIATDASGGIQIMNPVAERVSGWTLREANGRPIWDVFRIVDEKTREAPEDPALKALREKCIVEDDSHILITRDESDIPIECISAPIVSGDGSVAGAVVVFRDITQRRRAEDQKTMIVGELNHRVRNILTIVHSLVHASAQYTAGDSAQEMADVLASRLQSLGRAHDLLLETHWEGASLKGIIERELEPFKQEKGKKITIKGSNVLLPPQCTSVMAMALHELTTNAAKYGALGQPDGRLAVDWRMRRSTLTLRWTESHTKVKESKRQGFGTRLIERGIQQNLGGKAEVTFAADGLRAKIEVPLERGAQNAARPATSAKTPKALEVQPL